MPTSLLFHAGESIEVAISGMPYMVQQSEFSDLKLETINKGNHILHCGGKYDSHILLPFIPEK